MPNTEILRVRDFQFSGVKNKFVLPSVLVASIMGVSNSGCRSEQILNIPAVESGRIALERTGELVRFTRTGRTESTLVANNHFLVYFEPEATVVQRRSVEEILHEMGIRKVGENTYSHMVEFSIPSMDQLNGLLNIVERLPGVFVALPDAAMSGLRDPNPNPTPTTTTHYYWINQINARRAWDISIGSASVPIAVVDSMVDFSTDIFPRNIIVRNELCRTPDGSAVRFHEIVHPPVPSNCDEPYTSDPHGTQVASLMVASGEDGVEYVGMAWNNHLRSYDVYGTGPTGAFPYVTVVSRINAAIDQAINDGARVINNSVGPTQDGATAANFIDYRLALRNSIIHAHERDVLVVFAAGNSNVNDDVLIPIDCSRPEGCGVSAALTYYSNSLLVGGIASDNCKVRQSNFGRAVRIYAPGIFIALPRVTSTSHPGVDSGTSFAAPLVAGTAALMRSVNPSLSAETIARIIVSTANISDRTCSDGFNNLPVLDAFAAVGAAQQNNADASVQSDAAVVDASSSRGIRQFGLGAFDNITRMNDGGFVLAGAIPSSMIDRRLGGLLRFVKLDSNRNTIWDRQVDLTGSEHFSTPLPRVIVNSIVETQDGELLIGFSAGSETGLMKLNSTGNRVWMYREDNNPMHLRDNLYFTSTQGTSTTEAQFYRVISATDSTQTDSYNIGIESPFYNTIRPGWRSRYGSSNELSYRNNGLYTRDLSTFYYYTNLYTGEITDAGTLYSRCWLGFVRYDSQIHRDSSFTELQNPSLVRVIEMSSGSMITTREPIVVSDGIVFSLNLGRTVDPDSRVLITKLGLDGNEIWRGTFNIPQSLVTYTQDETGNLILVANRTPGIWTVVKINSTGNLVLTRDVSLDANDSLTGIVSTTDGYLISGYNQGGEPLRDLNSILIHLDTNGNLSD